nr:uncharacterized protein At5g08430-like [Ipomoea batatas]
MKIYSNYMNSQLIQVPVQTLRKAVSTLVDSRADVSVKNRFSFSAYSLASSVDTSLSISSSSNHIAVDHDNRTPAVAEKYKCRQHSLCFSSYILSHNTARVWSQVVFRVAAVNSHQLLLLFSNGKRIRKFGSGSNKMKVQNKKRKSRRNKLEFLVWGSKPLIEFLDSIGKESRQYSQGEVDAIMKKYVACNNLIDRTYKRRILCDERLEKLFKKKIVSRKNVYHLLEVHFRENHVVVDDDAQDNAPLLFSLRLRLRFFQSESRQYSQGEVDAIMKKYVACNNLIDRTYKRRIMCDERLEKLFKKKIVSRKNVYHLLEVHFRENHVVVDDDAQDNAPLLFSLRLRLRFFQSVEEPEPEPPLMGAPTSQELKEKAN